MNIIYLILSLNHFRVELMLTDDILKPQYVLGNRDMKKCLLMVLLKITQIIAVAADCWFQPKYLLFFQLNLGCPYFMVGNIWIDHPFINWAPNLRLIRQLSYPSHEWKKLKTLQVGGPYLEIACCFPSTLLSKLWPRNINQSLSWQ